MKNSVVHVLAFLAALSTSAPAGAEDRDDAERAYRGARSGDFLPVATLMRTVRAAYPGEIVEAELDEDDGEAQYEFYVLQADGRMIEVKVDARSGRILEVEGED